MKGLTRHIAHYLPLLGLLFAGVLGFIFFAYDQVFQILISVSVAVLYVAWGIVHHLIHQDLDLSVVIEYLVVASLGLVIVFSLIFRT